MSRIVFTGGPGTGKTTLLLALQALGCTTVGDSARAVIQERRQRGLPPRPNAPAFAQEVLRRDAENHAAHAATPGLVFFDRGVVDALGMLAEVMPLTESELSDRLAKYPYEPKVFVFPAWREIYLNDAERDHPFEHAEAVDRSVRAWYARCGYQVVEVPKVSVAERCAFVTRAVLAAGPWRYCASYKTKPTA